MISSLLICSSLRIFLKLSWSGQFPNYWDSVSGFPSSHFMPVCVQGNTWLKRRCWPVLTSQSGRFTSYSLQPQTGDRTEQTQGDVQREYESCMPSWHQGLSSSQITRWPWPIPSPPGPQSYRLVLLRAVLDIIYYRVGSPLYCNCLTEVLSG